MAVHDRKQINRTNLMANLGRDALISGRRVNQNAEIVSMIAEGIAQATASGVPNGGKNTLDMIFINVQNSGPVVAEWEITAYIDAVAPENVLFPFNSAVSTVDPTDFQILGPASALNVNDADGDYNDINVHNQRLTIINISAGTVDIIYEVRARYIFNRG
jgi:hypothetical protein